MAAGYQAASPTDYPVVAYVNPTIVAANAAAKRTLNPGFIDGLLYAETPSGTERAGRRLLHPALDGLERAHALRRAGAVAPPPGRVRRAVRPRPPCRSTSRATRRVPSGTTLTPTPYLSVVWQVPVAGGPLAIQPPDIQIVEAAVMSTLGS